MRENRVRDRGGEPWGKRDPTIMRERERKRERATTSERKDHE